jgi:hypothetical protein
VASTLFNEDSKARIMAYHEGHKFLTSNQEKVAMLGSFLARQDGVATISFFAWLCMGLVREREIAALNLAGWKDDEFYKGTNSIFIHFVKVVMKVDQVRF